MWYLLLMAEFERLADPLKAVNMAAYMKNKFMFLGIQKPVRAAFVKEYFSAVKDLPIEWDFVQDCYKIDYREYQYIALDYLKVNIKKLKLDDLDKLKWLIVNKSWWDTCDTIDELVGHLLLQHPQIKETMIEWSLSDNIWLKRVSINCQLGFKDKTDTNLLESVICNNLGSDEFFVNKAIGWALREYGKSNMEWVKAFLNKYDSQLSKLSYKEASKRIENDKSLS